jgi:2-amino-4-hydroxy-6-hydroxymethyldihydropteridine diphosphokinase
MNKTYLGLGSNLGDRERNLLRAAAEVSARFALLDHSSIYETRPVGYTDQPDFLNMVIAAGTGECPPGELLGFVKSIERKLGREETFRWGPRVIDIDILYMEGVEIHTPELAVPHRELLNRNFVLAPLSELTDSIVVGGGKVELAAHLRENDGDDRVHLYRSREDLSGEDLNRSNDGNNR